jgi:hypothetical protein
MSNEEKGDGTYTCGICCDDLTEKKVTLVCDPKHVFCKPCILDWYKAIAKYSASSFLGGENNEENLPHVCPICRKDGGFLSLDPGESPIYNIHFDYYYKKILPVALSNLQAFGSLPSYYPVGAVAGAGSGCKCLYENGEVCNGSLNEILQLPGSTRFRVCTYHYNQYQKQGKNLNHQTRGLLVNHIKKCSCYLDGDTTKSCRNKALTNSQGYAREINHKGAIYYMCRTHWKNFQSGKYVCVEGDRYIHVDPSKPAIEGHDAFILHQLQEQVASENLVAEKVKEEKVPSLPVAVNQTLTSLDSLIAILEEDTEKEVIRDALLGIIGNLTRASAKHQREETAHTYTKEEFDLFVAGIKDNARCGILRSDDSPCTMPGDFAHGGKCIVHRAKTKIWKGLAGLTEDRIELIVQDALSQQNSICNVVKPNGTICRNKGQLYYSGCCNNHWDPKWIPSKKWAMSRVRQASTDEGAP